MITNIKNVEEMIQKLGGVISSKIIGTEEQIDEIHVLTNQSRHPKQISRDIQSIFIAITGEPIDRKLISIAQLDIEKPKADFGRIIIDEVRYHVSTDSIAEAMVTLKVSDTPYQGMAQGVNTSRNSERLIVGATLDSLHQAYGIDPKVVLEDIKLVTMAGQSVYNVAICSLNNDNEEMHVGSAIVRGDSRSALVKATLDALNRRINLMLK